MRKHLLLKVAISAGLLLSFGCAHVAVDKQLQKGNFAGAEKAAEAEYDKDATDLTSKHLVRKCLAYSKLKKYDELYKCLEGLEARIAAGDSQVGYGVWTYSTVFPDDVTLVPLLMRAEAAVDTGHYDTAIRLAENVYSRTDEMSAGDKMFSWDKITQMQSLAVIIMAYSFSGHKEKALTYIDTQENQSVGFGGFYFAGMQKNLALMRSYMALGRYDKILDVSSRVNLADLLLDIGSLGVLKVVKEAGFFGYTELPREYVQTKALFETGEIKKAKTLYDKLLNNPGTVTNGEINWAMLYDRGRIAELEYDRTAAIGFYKKAIDIIEIQRSSINTEASKIGFVGDKQAVYSALIFALLEADRKVAAFEYVERSKSRALVDMLASADSIKTDTTEVARYISDIHTTDLLAASNDLELDKPEVVTRSISIKKKLIETAPDTASLVTVGAKDAGEITSSLDEDETLLEYYFRGDRGTAFVITHTGLQAFGIETKDLNGLVEQFRKEISIPGSHAYGKLSERLYTMLISPVEGALHTDRLVIVPHGVMHYVPFAALCHGRCLIDRYSISLLPSASTAFYIKRHHSESPNILALGNPDLGNPAYGLAFAEKETKEIAGLFTDKGVYVRGKASESIVKNIGGKYSYVHFATHGTFDAGTPLSSGLYLAKDSDNDGLLTVGELYGLRLNADLVTLSACETGLGRIRSGDDLIGLQRGFLYAGASSIISTLWKVDDVATSELMVSFYQNLKGHYKSDALRRAQLEIKDTYEHPYYWAAFQLTGKSD